MNRAEKPYLSTFELGNTYDKKGKAKPRKIRVQKSFLLNEFGNFLSLAQEKPLSFYLMEF